MANWANVPGCVIHWANSQAAALRPSCSDHGTLTINTTHSCTQPVGGRDSSTRRSSSLQPAIQSPNHPGGLSLGDKSCKLPNIASSTVAYGCGVVDSLHMPFQLPFVPESRPSITRWINNKKRDWSQQSCLEPASWVFCRISALCFCHILTYLRPLPSMFSIAESLHLQGHVPTRTWGLGTGAWGLVLGAMLQPLGQSPRWAWPTQLAYTFGKQCPGLLTQPALR